MTLGNCFSRAQIKELKKSVKESHPSLVAKKRVIALDAKNKEAMNYFSESSTERKAWKARQAKKFV